MTNEINILNQRMETLEKQMDVIIKLLGQGISTNNINEQENNEIGYGTLLSLTPKQTACLQMIHEGYGTKEMSKVSTYHQVSSIFLIIISEMGRIQTK